MLVVGRFFSGKVRYLTLSQQLVSDCQQFPRTVFFRPRRSQSCRIPPAESCCHPASSPAITSSTPCSPALSVDLNVAFNRRKVSPRWRRNDMPVSVSDTSGAKRRAEVRGGEVREGKRPPRPIYSVRSASSLLQFRRDLKTALFQSSYSSP